MKGCSTKSGNTIVAKQPRVAQKADWLIKGFADFQVHVIIMIRRKGKHLSDSEAFSKAKSRKETRNHSKCFKQGGI